MQHAREVYERVRDRRIEDRQRHLSNTTEKRKNLKEFLGSLLSDSKLSLPVQFAVLVGEHDEVYTRAGTWPKKLFVTHLKAILGEFSDSDIAYYSPDDFEFSSTVGINQSYILDDSAIRDPKVKVRLLTLDIKRRVTGVVESMRCKVETEFEALGIKIVEFSDTDVPHLAELAMPLFIGTDTQDYRATSFVHDLLNKLPEIRAAQVTAEMGKDEVMVYISYSDTIPK